MCKGLRRVTLPARRMKLSISTYSLSRWRKEQNKTLEQTIDFVASTGVPGIEFSGLDQPPPAHPLKRAAQLRKRCEAAGLAAVSYCVPAELLVPGEKQLDAVSTLKHHVDIAQALGVRSMRHDVTRGFGEYSKGVKIPKTFAAVVKYVVPAIREVADYAAGRGVKTSLENHGFYMQASERVEQLIKAVGHPNFGLTLDMGNFLCVNEDPVKAVRRLAKYAVMAHAKDFHVRPKRTMPPVGWFETPTEIALRGAICGHGVVDVPAQLKLLKQSGYNGYVSLEFEGMEEPTQAVTLGVNYLRELMKKVS